MQRNSLPLGVQDFEKLRNEGSVYVDKTEWIYKLVQPYLGLYFLSRPRRFGKTLLLSTLTCLFEGKRELFKGLWIDSHGDWDWKPHPVVSIDFNRMDHETPDALKKSIHKTLDNIIEENDLKITTDIIPMKFGDIIVALEKKADASVVVLMDEYDKPIHSHLGKGEEEVCIAAKNRDVLKQLFGTLKAFDVAPALRFVFLTGVSKFARVSVFSDLNNLSDLTMNPDYASLLGYTEEELYHYFDDYISELQTARGFGKEKCKTDLRTWYNGYRFSDKELKVYNPFSILCVFANKRFKNYWYETGTPSFLLNLIKSQDYPIPEVEKLELDESSFSTYEIENLRIEALLFQTGYLTIAGHDEYFYTLDYPNQEVKSSFMKNLYYQFTEIKSLRTKDSFKLLAKYLKEEKSAEFISTVNTILASVTYHQLAHQNEPFYHTVFYLMLSASGVEVVTELLTSQGRMDIAVFFEDKIYIIELKCNHDAETAIRQIKEKKYADKYKTHGKRIILMGINFDTEKRELADWKMEEL